VNRRAFITLLGGAAAAWPLAARAQQGEHLPRIAVRTGMAETDAVFRDRMAAFRHELQQLGWTDGRNVRIDVRAGGSTNPERIRKDVAELLALAPNVIVAAGSPTVGVMQQATRTVPIVFVGVVDPVGAGFVASLARPGDNITGFTSFEYGIGAKWLELLKQIDPRVTRAAVLRDPANPAGIGLFAAMQGVAPSLGVELTPVGVRNGGEIERAIVDFARGSNGGLVVTLSASTIAHRDLISTLAARHRLPAIYPYSYFVRGGGLFSYGPDPVDLERRAAGYVDRILRGEKPANLPVQNPTKYELVINLKTAKALGLEVPTTVLARADEVIE
jgi:putative tryptophan/tyrosine transport system substrate-binding protein